MKFICKLDLGMLEKLWNVFSYKVSIDFCYEELFLTHMKPSEVNVHVFSWH